MRAAVIVLLSSTTLALAQPGVTPAQPPASPASSGPVTPTPATPSIPLPPPSSPPPTPPAPIQSASELAGSQHGLVGTALTVPAGRFELSARAFGGAGAIGIGQIGLAIGISDRVELWFDGGVLVIDDEGLVPLTGGGLKVVLHRARRWQVAVNGGVHIPGILNVSAAATTCLDERCILLVSGTAGLAGGGGSLIPFAAGSISVGYRGVRAFGEAVAMTEEGAFAVAGARIGDEYSALEGGVGTTSGESSGHIIYLGLRLRI